MSKNNCIVILNFTPRDYFVINQPVSNPFTLKTADLINYVEDGMGGYFKDIEEAEYFAGMLDDEHLTEYGTLHCKVIMQDRNNTDANTSLH
jgi:hypothetical protein